ncbi:MAG TPA: hypothetical protein VFW86_02600, partial [Candidatus Limnocylindrales bacterium]|nr:hypothetical protein [Candidatus Limnocylindrales bacterium]
EGRDLERAQTILLASWGALDHAVEAVEAAGGRELARGPRGGGRSLRAVIGHVAEAERAYLSRLGRPATPGTDRTAILDALADVGPIGTPPPGPRGGRRWSARFFVRRACWHALDHAWEIEDRTTPA